MATKHYIHNPLRIEGIFSKTLNTRKEIQYKKMFPRQHLLEFITYFKGKEVLLNPIFHTSIVYFSLFS